MAVPGRPEAAGRSHPARVASGWVMYWARAGSWAPRLTNTLTQAPLLRHLVRWALGAPRVLPPLAPCRFQHEVRGLRSPAAGGPCGRRGWPGP